MRTIQNKIMLMMAVSAVLMVASCTSYKNVPYIQNSDELELKAALHDVRIKPKDELMITVSCPDDPAAVAQFNLLVSGAENTNDSKMMNTQKSLTTFLVSNDGTIDFPVLGKIRVNGMTEDDVEEYIVKKIEGTYLKTRPVVSVRIENFKFSVLGEVSSPGTFTVPAEKVNVFYALSMAKDLTIYGHRENVKLIREDANGQKTIHELNLNDANLVNSPYYFLQQNDVLYVTPNKTKAKNSDIGSATNYWISGTGIVISVASLLTTVLMNK